MPITLQEVRQKYPQYDNMSDDQLAGALHKKFYSNMPVEEFRAKIGLIPSSTQNLDPARVPPRNPPLPFRETMAGNVGEMLYGVPVAGPALLGGAQRVAALSDAYSGGKPYAQSLEDIQTRQENFRREQPVMSGSAQAGGATLATLGAGAAGPVGRTALGITGRNLATRSLASGTTGATIGGADAYVRGNDPVTGAAVGGTFGLVAPAVGGMAGRTVRAAMGRGAPAIPTVDDMRTIKEQAYQTVSRLGAQYTPGSYNLLASSIANKAFQRNISVTRHPQATGMLRRMIRTVPTTWRNPGAPTLTELDQLRQVIRRDVANSADNAEAEFGNMMIDQIDDFIDQAKPAMMAGGNAKAANDAILAARKANTQYKKAEMLSDAVDRAQRQAAVTGSGGNVENTTRQAVNRILNNPQRLRSFTKEERDVMRAIADPKSRTQDVMRLVGKLSPSGNGLMAALGLGATAFNPMFAIPAGAGIAAKRISEGMTQGRVNKLQQLVHTGGVQRPPLTGAPNVARRVVQAGTLGVPLSQYPTLGSPLLPYLPSFSASSAREPR